MYKNCVYESVLVTACISRAVYALLAYLRAGMAPTHLQAAPMKWDIDLALSVCIGLFSFMTL